MIGQGANDLARNWLLGLSSLAFTLGLGLDLSNSFVFRFVYALHSFCVPELDIRPI